MKKIILVLALSIFAMPTIAEESNIWPKPDKTQKCKETYSLSGYQILTLGETLLKAYDQEERESIFTIHIPNDLFWPRRKDASGRACIVRGIYQCAVSSSGFLQCEGGVIPVGGDNRIIWGM